MNQTPIYLQLYSVREAAKQDFVATLKQVAAMGYDGVEFAGLHNQDPRELKRVLDDVGLTVCSMHGPLPNKDNLQQLQDLAGLFGHRHLVHGRRTEQCASHEALLQATSGYRDAAAVLEGTGLSLSIHNHYWEFDHLVDGRTPYEWCMELAPTVGSELDSYWTQAAGHSPAAILQRYAGRIPLLHIKDGDCACNQEGMTAIGEGRMIWPPILAAAKTAGVQHYIVELDKYEGDLHAALTRSAATLHSLLTAN